MKTDTLTRAYQASIEAAIPAHKAFENICQPSAWWVGNTEGEAKKSGDVFTVHFSETSFVTFRLGEVIPDKKIVWHVADCYLPHLNDKKEWNGTDIVWEISSGNGSTRIDMTHVGLVPEVECYEQCETGWNHYIKESLFKLITEGKGLPKV